MLSNELRNYTELLIEARLKAKEITLNIQASDSLINLLGTAWDVAIAYENVQQNLASISTDQSSAQIIPFPIIARRTASQPDGGAK